MIWQFCFAFEELSNYLPKEPHHFTTSPAVYESFNFFTNSCYYLFYILGFLLGKIITSLPNQQCLLTFVLPFHSKHFLNLQTLFFRKVFDLQINWADSKESCLVLRQTRFRSLSLVPLNIVPLYSLTERVPFSVYLQKTLWIYFISDMALKRYFSIKIYNSNIQRRFIT